MTTELKPIRYLIEAARIHPARALPMETHPSLPIPVAGEIPGVTFLFATSRLVPRQGMFLFPPSYRALILARDGHFQELRSMSPADLGLSDDPTKPLGTHALPRDVTSEEFTVLEQRLLTAYDGLLPSFFDGGPAGHGGASTARVAKEFRALFAQISEHVLLPYYHAVGKRFFAWLDATLAAP